MYLQGTIRKIWTWCLNAAHQQERYLLSTTSCRRMMLVLHISAESVKRLQHICILDALRSPERERKCSWSVAAARQPELKLSDSFLKHTIVLSQCTIICLWLLSFQQDTVQNCCNIQILDNISRFCKDSPKILQRFWKDSAKILQRFSKDSSKILQRFFNDSPKILQRFFKDLNFVSLGRKFHNTKHIDAQ